MDQDASDDKISLRDYADQLCPDEAATLKGPIIWDHSNTRIGLAITPTLALRSSSFRAMAEAIINAAADRQSSIWRDGIKLPTSFFIHERAEALAMIEPALKQDDSLFRVHKAQVASAGLAGLRVTEHEIGAWMLDKQQELKSKAQPHGRDKLISLAMEHFLVKQDQARRAWDGRVGGPKRE